MLTGGGHPSSPTVVRSLHASSIRLGASSPELGLPCTPQRLTRGLHLDAPTDAETVKVPSMAESITEGTLKQWLKQEGDYVEADEEVATIETDKVRTPYMIQFL